jgi:hypothetical protein
VDGETSLMKRYDGPNATKDWLADIKMLQTVLYVPMLWDLCHLLTHPASHPNLPQLIGISSDGTPSPFILITSVTAQRTPEAYVLHVLGNLSLADSVGAVLRLVSTVRPSPTQIITDCAI